jgi:HSP20 family protein
MLVRSNHFNDLTPVSRSLREFDDLVRGFFGDHAATAQPWTPAVDIAETEQELIVKADVPEMKPENIEVKVENGTLTLKGKREFQKKEDNKGFHRIERSYGSFVRAFTLPETIDAEKVEAGYKDGVLTVTLAKKELAKPRTVKVNVEAA